MAWAYNYILRNHQDKMALYFKWLESLRVYENNFVLKASLKYGLKMLNQFQPQSIVSVHPMTQHFTAKMVKILGWQNQVPLVTVVTDPGKGAWKGWVCPDVNHYVVAHDAAYSYLVEEGVPKEKIHKLGMPIHPKFQPIHPPEAKQLLKESLGLDPDKFTVLLSAGWIGGGNAPKLFEELLALNTPNLQVVYLCGQNKKLYKEALKQTITSKSNVEAKIMPYVTNVELWMQTADVLVSKLGGLTTYEALATELPVLADCLTPPMPQEAGTVKIIDQTGAGKLIENPGDLTLMIKLMMENPTMLEAMKNNTKQLIIPKASEKIAELVLSL
jgi:UDP-N-acetylglucosamine:LPS N-acetylglucosamine transferase